MSKTAILSATAIAASLFAACSSDNDSDIAESTDAMKFTASVPLAPRSVTTTQNLQEFHTWSFVGGKPYVSDAKVKRNGSSWESTPVQYWPAEDAVNIYSISPRISPNQAPKSDSANVPGYRTDGMTDLVYAVNMDQTRQQKIVNVNFRHALSQLRFAVKTESEATSGVDIEVDVNKIKLFNISQVGSFTFPSETTSQDSDVKGVWTGITDAEDCIVTGTPFTVGEEVVNIDSPEYIFAIPQAIAQVNAHGTSYTGPYVGVLCKIRHKTNGTLLWPSHSNPNYVSPTEGGWLIFPLNKGDNFGWESGKSYNYTLTVGIPSSTQQIDFDVTVDEYSTFDDIQHNI